MDLIFVVTALAVVALTGVTGTLHALVGPLRGFEVGRETPHTAAVLWGTFDVFDWALGVKAEYDYGNRYREVSVWVDFLCYHGGARFETWGGDDPCGSEEPLRSRIAEGA